ncbi:hypothetical protein HYU92_05835 [Candidatus Curtissbacteria bacterium]|nr:hypothetical protein [Candidatus Curtissbacteria bacterium]
MVGIVYARGSISHKRKLFKYLNICSTNRALLEAIKVLYGGSVIEHNDSLRLTIGKKSATRLFLNASLPA